MGRRILAWVLPVAFAFTTGGCIIEDGCLDHERSVENNSDSTVVIWAVNAEPLGKDNEPTVMYSLGPGEWTSDNSSCGLKIQSALLEDGTLVAERPDPVRCYCEDGSWEVTQDMVDQARSG